MVANFIQAKNMKMESPFCRQAEVIQLLGSKKLLARCEKAGWVSRRAGDRNTVLYRREDVWTVIWRIDKGELPPSLYKLDSRAAAQIDQLRCRNK
jgi:hypothetical protein